MKKITILVSILSLLLFGMVMGQDEGPPNDAKEKYNAGIIAAQAGKNAEAAVDFQAAIASGSI